MHSNNFFFVVACFLMATGILLGAFGAHLLQNTLDNRAMKAFQTATDYQLLHGLALLILAKLRHGFSGKLFIWAQWLLLVGTFLFAASLYVLVLVLVSVQWIAFITPFGGLCLIAGWVLLGFHFLLFKKSQKINKDFH